TTWSPYYRVDFRPPIWLVETNLISHQRMEEVKNPSAAPYALPYLFQRDLKTAGGVAWPEFKRVLIIGAGSGNDVARATQWLPKDATIDAVEIDPVIQRIGADHHPDRPYSDPRVKVHLTDGRNFLRRADAETYDLVIFALVDSLVLQSGHPNLRLESYLFTQESFADVARVLRPTGVCVVYNFFRQGWLVARLRDELRAAFGGADPVVVSTPSPTQVEQKSLKEIDLDTFEPQGFTSIFAGKAAAVDPLRAAFDRHWKYWLPWRAAVPTDTPARFGPEPPPQPPPVPPNPYLNKTHDPLPTRWLGVRPATVEETNGALEPATDDWPFLYMRTRTIPGLTWRGIGLVLVLSGVVWLLFRPREGGQAATTFGADRGPMLRSFFLGAGFMLVETKAVVHMALLSGGTWTVNSVVFAAILLMSLAGALVAGWLRPRRLELFYAGLFGTLAVGLAVPLDRLLGYDPTTRLALAGLVAFAPIAFAGVIFAGCLARSAHPDRVYAANVAGALVGGLAENASVVLGFQYLLCVAVGFYALSSACGNRTLPAVAAEKSV
ncbi:MAG: hypothetical protein K2P78_01110, partial [Gemmataceae bacterium]|nr:hypothetical protein [Gemmataceae bacterium]